MSSDFEAYEQDFGTITAEVTNKIGRIPKLSGGKTVKYISWNRWAGASYQLADISELGKLANGSRCSLQYMLCYFINFTILFFE